MCPLEKLEVAILAIDIDDTTATRECNENYIYRQGCGIAPPGESGFKQLSS
jgi:hypothetical protein